MDDFGQPTRARQITFAVIIAVLIMTVFIATMRFAKAQDAAIGDSIALGTGEALGVETYARTGVSSCYILGHMPNRYFDHVVISAGINDPPGACLGAILDRVRAHTVTLIVPAAINSAAQNVFRLAAVHRVELVSYQCWHGCTKWNFHPASYGRLAIDVRKTWK